MQVGPPQPTEPISLGATNANGWVYGLFELAVVVGIVLLIALPWWGKRPVAWLFRPFGSKGDDERQ